MSSRFTESVGSGGTTEFPDFARDCARAFGFLFGLRGPSFDEPLPNEIKPDTSYHRKRLEESVAELNAVVAWDEETAAAEALKSYLQSFKGHLKAVREHREAKARYSGMLMQVEAWQPPTKDHKKLKKFMGDQLVEAIRFDCYDPEEYRPKLLSGAEFKEQRIESLARIIGHSTEDLFRAEDRAAEATGWVQDLQASLADWQSVEVPRRQLP